MSDTVQPPGAQPQGIQAEWFGHPRGLSTLFFTELWERLSYYGMRALLILFMTAAAIEGGGLGMNAEKAGAIYGLYTAGVYLLALPGGWIADHIWGQRKAVFVGGCIIAAGHFTMALPVLPGMDGQGVLLGSFYGGLVLIVIGTGLLKPNVSAIVGDLYPDRGARRDAGFSIFYMGINVGAFVGPLLCGWLGERVDWHWGFSAAGFGMLLGVIQYRFGEKYLGDAGILKVSDKTGSVEAAKRKLFAGLAAILGTLAVLYMLRATLGLTLIGVAQSLGLAIGLFAVAFFGYVLLFGGLDKQEKKRVVVIFFLFLGAALFWSGFEQAGSSMNLFAEDFTNRHIGDWEMPASWLQSVNPLFIILLAPVFAWLWVFLGKREPSIPFKFGIGLILLGAGFLVLSLGSTRIPAAFVEAVRGGKEVVDHFAGVGMGWLVITYLLHTCGELCLSPVGLSSVTKLSPKRYVGQMMGTWFMGAALGNLIAGLIGGKIESLPLPQLFSTVATIVIVSGGLFLVFTMPIKKLIGDLSQSSDD